MLQLINKSKAVKESTKYFNTFSKKEEENFAEHLLNLFHIKDWRQREKIIIICIGSDRSTGDSLGPLTGSILSASLPSSIQSFGNLKSPVHALNLQETLDGIETAYADKLILAVDACLGSRDKVGFVELGLGHLFPGSSLNKQLPPVGDIYINGIVNSGGFMDYMVLQSTRLSSVISIAKFIADGICSVLCDSKTASRSGESVVTT